MDATERKLIYNTYNSKIIVDRTISFDIVNISTADETIIKNLSTITVQIEKEDYYNNYSGKVSYFIYDYVKDIQIVKSARIEILVDSYERDEIEVVADYIAYYPFKNGSLVDYAGLQLNYDKLSASTTTGVKGDANGAYAINTTTNNYIRNADNELKFPYGYKNWAFTCWVRLKSLAVKHNIFTLSNVTPLFWENGNFKTARGNQIAYSIANEWVFLAVNNNWSNAPIPTDWRSRGGSWELVVNQTSSGYASGGTSVGFGVPVDYVNHGTGNSHFDIDNLRFYNRNLSSVEIEKIRNFEKP
jgi:hypothetical protein